MFDTAKKKSPAYQLGFIIKRKLGFIIKRIGITNWLINKVNPLVNK